MDATTPTTKLDAYIQSSVQQLLRGKDGRQEDSLLFLGNWHGAYPAALVVDPALSATDVRVYLFIKHHALEQSRGPTAFPSWDLICNRLRISRATLAQSLVRLRMTRWLSLCRSVRDEQGRFRGSVYALHDEPVSLMDALYLDPGYMELVEGMAHGHPDQRTTAAARAVLAGIEDDIQGGSESAEQPNSIDRRLCAVEAVSTGTGRFYGVVVDYLKPSSKTELGQTPSSKIELGPDQPSSKIELGGQVIEKQGSSKIELGDSGSSSSSNKTTTTTTTGDAGEKDGPPMRWPKMLTDNERRLIARWLKTIPGNYRQQVLDALELRLRAIEQGAPPLRYGPIPYLKRLCERVRDGTFEPVDLPEATKDAAGAAEDGSGSPPAQASALRGEIEALEQLARAASSDDTRDALRRQIQRLQARLGHE